jgi:undecaprenyl-diphosphatase
MAFEERKFTWFVLMATIPIAVVGVLLSDYVDTIFNNLILVGVSFIITGVWLLSTKWSFPRKQINFRRSFMVGLGQAVAIIPGISRSGSTIATGMLLGFSKEDAARFSFLLSIPTIGGAFIYEVLSTPMNDVLTAPNIAGFITSFIVGIFTIKFLLYTIKKGRFYAFAFYVIPLGIFTILYALTA